MECSSCRGTVDAEERANFCPWCAAKLETADPSDGDPRIGQLVGARFRILRLLGEGGMGRVYVAEQRMGATHRLVALKMVRPEIAGDRRIVDRFLHECAIAGGLRHPNTVRVFDFGETDAGEIYLAMELLEGRSLTTILAEGPMPLERAEQILAQICGSLQEAHALGIVHRDLKPDNVIVGSTSDRDDFVKVLDFGIARQEGTDVEPTDRLTQRGAVVGTPEYMSPEQVEGKLVDARSDVYSLGLITYELLAGRRAFDADSPLAWASRHLRGEPVALAATHAGAGLPPHVHETVMRALAKSAQDRPTSAKAFYDELTLARSRHSVFALPPTSRPTGAPVSSASIGGADTLRDAAPSFAQIIDEAQRPGGDQRAQRTARRWRIAALLLALVVVALGLGIVVMEITHHATPEPRRKPKPAPTVAPSGGELGR